MAPLNAVLGIIELALHENMTPDVREYLIGAKDAGNNLLSIIVNVLHPKCDLN
jgi:hypothetical protein